MKRALCISTFVLSCILIGGCGKDENALKVENQELTLHYQEKDIIVSNAVNPVYTSSDEYYATVSEDGTVTAGFVGETTVKLVADNGTANVKVVVEPKYFTFNEPITTWGLSKQEIINKFGTPDSTTDGAIMYLDYDQNVVYMYSFDSVGLSGAMVMISNTRKTEVNNFIKERYSYYGYDGGFSTYLNSLNKNDATVSVGLGNYNSTTYAVLYVPNPLK